MSYLRGMIHIPSLVIGVYPEVLFNDVSLHADQVTISDDGVLSLSPGVSDNLVSMSLFGRVYDEDPPYPDQFCPHRIF